MAEIWRVDLLYTVAGQACSGTFHLRGDRVGLPDEFLGSADDVSGAVDTELTTAFRGVLHTTHTFTAIRVTSVPDPQDTGALPEQHERAVGLAGTRTSTTSDAPPELTGMLKLRTGIPSRSFRGRLFMPPAEAETEFTSNLWDSGGQYSSGVAAFVAALDDFLLSNGGVVGTWDATDRLALIVYSRTRADLNLEPDYAHVTSIIWDRKPRWLRSRSI